MPASVLLIIQGIMAIVQAAPQIASVIAGAKNLINDLVSGKVIPAEVQGPLHAWVDSRAALAALGVVPISWTVEPDPIVTAPTPSTPKPVA